MTISLYYKLFSFNITFLALGRVGVGVAICAVWKKASSALRHISRRQGSLSTWEIQFLETKF